MTGQAHAAARLPQHGVVVRAVRIVATEAGDAARVHQAGHEVVALHAVLVRRAIGEMGERRLAEFVILELPEVVEVQADVKADRPVIVFALDRVLERPPLRMTLDAGVVRMHIVEAARD